MKNLLKLGEEKLEVLPSRDKIRLPKNVWGRYQEDYDNGRVERFFTTNIGHNWDEVYSKYCKLEWLPKQYKNMETVRQHITVDTFIKDEKVHFIEKYGSGEKTIESAFYKRDILYIHPTTKILCSYRGKHINYKKKHAEQDAKTMRILGDYHQLLKFDGIWHEVKGKVVPSDIVVIDGLHWRKSNFEPVYRERRNEHVIGVERELLLPGGIKTKTYKIIDGKIAVPDVPYGYRYEKKPIGPRDRMIEEKTSRPAWSWRNVDRNRLKITLCRQLGRKELKHHGLKNDVKIFGPRCKKCGGVAGKDCLYHICSVCDKYKEDCKCYGDRR